MNIHAGCYLAQFIGIKEDAFLVPGRSRLTMNEALELDVEYVRCRSLTLDLLILAMTVPAVLWGGNAR